ncbi:MAG: NADH-quinone oxidoreductase subunit L [Chloroflexota bacterium]|nr:NADH-quinone oxidoreductase subunit L [Chloroflexota bacterium]MDE2894535.1 NADH-quinone oxidoreductase subunit L [Chloroflexota bacterium]
MPETIFWVILFLPLTAFVLAGISAVNQNLQRQIPEWDPNYPRSWKPIADLFCGPRLASTPLIIALAVAFLLAVINLIDSIGLRGLPLNIGTHELFTAGELIVNVGVRIDGLTSVMLVVVTGVSLLVQVYSTGYMDGDHGYRRYFAFMALFTTSMLGLVLADNLLMLFAFWELVGLTSYLLIGFWFHRSAAAAAAKKAFLVTRLGDLGMLAAMILIFSKTGTLDIAAINALADSGAEAGMFAFNGLLIGQTAMTLFGLGLIAGAVGKSAQFPLHIWLPDAMEGPTPVSALVHSATMVAAGVYLLARFFPVIHASSTASDLIAWIGAGTALGAAILAMVQVDIKRVLAYSTISQLAYMMFAIGVGGYAAAVFHLMTHAFFKAMLFLGSGSVNHSTNTFDMRRMGGLRTLMPITFGTFIVGTLALAGIVPLSGFWSKDEILIEAWDNNKGVFVLGLLAAGLTAAYMVRAVYMTFFGEYRGGEEVAPGEHGNEDPSHPHESPRSMTTPLIILAVISVVSGFLTFGGEFQTWVYGALPDPHAGKFHWSWGIFLGSTALAVGAGFVAYWFMRNRDRVRSWGAGGIWPIPEAQKFATELFYLDALAENLLARRVFYGWIARSSAWFDATVVDGVVNRAWREGLTISNGARFVQNGWVQAGTISIGLGGMIIWIAVVLF